MNIFEFYKKDKNVFFNFKRIKYEYYRKQNRC